MAFYLTIKRSSLTGGKKPFGGKHLSSNAEYRWAVARGLSPSDYYPTLVHRDIAVAVVLFDAEIIEHPTTPCEPGVLY